MIFIEYKQLKKEPTLFIKEHTNVNRSQPLHERLTPISLSAGDYTETRIISLHLHLHFHNQSQPLVHYHQNHN